MAFSATAAVPSKAALSFEKFSVLDQGRHGACVTFASAAALNYVLDKPNHVSPLCSLELGNTLEKSSYYPSGWDGSFGPIVLDQFMRFGYITMAEQLKGNCGGVKNYPAGNGSDTGNPMSLPEYNRYSNSLLWEQLSSGMASKVFWSPIVTVEDRFNLTESDEAYDGGKALLKVKQAILNNKNNIKNIVTIGFLLYGDICHAGACGKHNAQSDTWAMTSSIKDLLKRGLGPDAGHEVTIIGYDDDAIAVDQNGISHQGLLTIRNSWGAKNGDKGNYYMTYDYFKTFVDEVQKISKVTLDLNN